MSDGAELNVTSNVAGRDPVLGIGEKGPVRRKTTDEFAKEFTDAIAQSGKDKVHKILTESRSSQWKAHSHWDKSGDGTHNTGRFAGTTAHQVSKDDMRARDNTHELRHEDEEIRRQAKMKHDTRHFTKPQTRHYFSIPFSDKEHAKKQGFNWDPEEKKWFFGTHGNTEPFKPGYMGGPNKNWAYTHTKKKEWK